MALWGVGWHARWAPHSSGAWLWTGGHRGLEGPVCACTPLSRELTLLCGFCPSSLWTLVSQGQGSVSLGHLWPLGTMQGSGEGRV